MKKLLVFSSFILVTVFSFGHLRANNQNIAPTSGNELATEFVACKFRQCNATAKSTGNRCKHCVSKDTHWQCWQHR